MPNAMAPSVDLRKSAEKQIASRRPFENFPARTDLERLLHELEVHQVELEMQNEELRRTQLQLQEARDSYSDLYDYAPVGYFSIDREGMISQVNHRGAEMLDADRRKISGTPFFRYVQLDDRGAFFSFLAKAFETGLRQTCDIRLSRRKTPPSPIIGGPAANTHDIHVSLAAITVAGGSRCRLTATDITGHRQAQDELAQRARELARSNAELENFAYIASHDLQEPLRMVNNYVQLIENRLSGFMDADCRRYLRRTMDGAFRMRSLIADLLAYATLPDESRALSPVDVNHALNLAVSNLRPVIDETGTRIYCRRLPVVMGDLTQLVQVFQNLLSNAIKFRSGRVPKIRVMAKRNGKFWEFRVSDNGIGIEDQYRERVFVIFQRLHGREKYPGNGIGLAVCKKVIDRHGGSMWLTSQPGRGSTFYFSLPSVKRQNVVTARAGVAQG
jgi:two-component system, chemotaxis family, sensor kinase Cph1